MYLNTEMVRNDKRILKVGTVKQDFNNLITQLIRKSPGSSVWLRRENPHGEKNYFMRDEAKAGEVGLFE